MSEGSTEIIVGLVAIVIIIALISGAVKTFRRNWLAALLLLIFIFPVWVIWAFIEMFTGEISVKKSSIEPSQQNVTVTVVQQSDGTTTKHSLDGLDEVSPYIEGTAVTNTLGIDAKEHHIKDAVKICKYCAEEIKASAVICRFCNRDA